MLHGIRLFGSKDSEYQVDLQVINCRNNEKLLDLEDDCFSSVPLPFKKDKIYVFDFLFDPIVLIKNNHYIVKALMRANLGSKPVKKNMNFSSHPKSCTNNYESGIFNGFTSIHTVKGMIFCPL